MMRRRSRACLIVGGLSLVTTVFLGDDRAALTAQGVAPPAPQAGRGAVPPPVVSPEVLADRRVVVRLLAPQAASVDVRGLGNAAPPMTKRDTGVWGRPWVRSLRACISTASASKA
jgi:hypothetical protein